MRMFLPVIYSMNTLGENKFKTTFQVYVLCSELWASFLRLAGGCEFESCVAILSGGEAFVSKLAFVVSASRFSCVVCSRSMTRTRFITFTPEHSASINIFI